jgi:hypothetical protein
MANALYPKGKQRLLDALIDLPTATVKAALLPNSYVYSGAHEFKSAMAHIGTPFTLTGKTITDGVFDAIDAYYTAVAGGATAQALGIYIDTGDDATSPLLAYIDTVTGLPLATNGGDIQIVWDNGPYKIFSL